MPCLHSSPFKVHEFSSLNCLQLIPVVPGFNAKTPCVHPVRSSISPAICLGYLNKLPANIYSFTLMILRICLPVLQSCHVLAFELLSDPRDVYERSNLTHISSARISLGSYTTITQAMPACILPAWILAICYCV